MNIRKIFFVLVAFICLGSSAFAYWVWSPEEGKFVNPVDDVESSAEEHYNYAMQFFKEGNLDEAIKQLQELLEQYPS